MPDTAIVAAAIASHSAALAGAVSRHLANASRCQAWSAGLVAGVLLLSAGQPRLAALPWLAGVVVLLALVEAGQAALARGNRGQSSNLDSRL